MYSLSTRLSGSVGKNAKFSSYCQYLKERRSVVVALPTFKYDDVALGKGGTVCAVLPNRGHIDKMWGYSTPLK